MESLDDKLSQIIDQLEDETENQIDWEDEEAVREFIDRLEEIRGVINP